MVLKKLLDAYDISHGGPWDILLLGLDAVEVSRLAQVASWTREVCHGEALWCELYKREWNSAVGLTGESKRVDFRKRWVAENKPWNDPRDRFDPMPVATPPATLPPMVLAPPALPYIVFPPSTIEGLIISPPPMIVPPCCWEDEEDEEDERLAVRLPVDEYTLHTNEMRENTPGLHKLNCGPVNMSERAHDTKSSAADGTTTFTFIFTIKQRSNIDADCASLSEADKRYDQHDSNGAFRLIFEGKQTVSLETNSRTEFEFDIENTVEPWFDKLNMGTLSSDDKRVRDMFERLEATLVIRRHSDGAMACVWKDLMVDDPHYLAFGGTSDYTQEGKLQLVTADSRAQLIDSVRDKAVVTNVPYFAMQAIVWPLRKYRPWVGIEGDHPWPPPNTTIRSMKFMHDQRGEPYEADHTVSAFLSAMSNAPIPWII